MLPHIDVLFSSSDSICNTYIFPMRNSEHLYLLSMTSEMAFMTIIYSIYSFHWSFILAFMSSVSISSSLSLLFSQNLKYLVFSSFLHCKVVRIKDTYKAYHNKEVPYSKGQFYLEYCSSRRVNFVLFRNVVL